VEWGWADNTRHRAISLRQQGFLVNCWRGNSGHRGFR